jgi:hypothetical protein
MSLRTIAAGLNDAGIPTARGVKWSAPQVRRMRLERLDPFREEEAAYAQERADELLMRWGLERAAGIPAERRLEEEAR